jgi:hypothetical protein
MPTALPRGHDALTPWIVVGTVWIMLAIASGLYFSFPIFFVALLEEFGWGPVEETLPRAMRRAKLRGGARRQHARRIPVR